MNRTKLYVLLALTVTLAGCETAPTKQDQGVLIGAVIGGLLGNQVGGGSGRVLATMVGAVAGAAIGGSIGRSMDESDQLKAAHAFENVRTGVPTSWVNPDTRNEYTVTPTRTFDSSTGPCREYTMEAIIGGEVEEIYGTACRQPDGSWKIQN